MDKFDTFDSMGNLFRQTLHKPQMEILYDLVVNADFLGYKYKIIKETGISVNVFQIISNRYVK